MYLLRGFTNDIRFTLSQANFRAQIDTDLRFASTFDGGGADGRCDQDMVARIHGTSVGQGERPAQAEKSL